MTEHLVNLSMPKCKDLGESSRELLDSTDLLWPKEMSHGRQMITCAQKMLLNLNFLWIERRKQNVRIAWVHEAV